MGAVTANVARSRRSGKVAANFRDTTKPSLHALPLCDTIHGNLREEPLMEACERIAWVLFLVAVVSLDPGPLALAQDLMTPIDVNVPCDGFEAYAKQHQSAILSAIGARARARTESYWGATLPHLLTVTPDRIYDIPSNSNRKRFHCACSGQDVDNYEVECPVGLRCFGDSRCPEGQDCTNKICGRERLSEVELVDSVSSAFFQWSPQPVPEQCRQTMSDWNRQLEQHEKAHNNDDRAALDALEAELSKFQTPEACESTVVTLKTRLDNSMDDLIKDTKRNFIDNIKGFETELHTEIGADSPPPDCSCVAR